MPDRRLTASLEDYLEVIYSKIETDKSVRAIEISKELGVSRASVTEALKKLAKEGLINYGRYENISITQEGIIKAKDVVSKHRILQDFFEDILGLEATEATENACKIEHVISKNAFDKLKKFIEYSKDTELIKKFKC